MALDKPLRAYGLNSERLLMPTKASSFEQEVADLEQKVGLTTLAKAVAWAQTNSMWPDTFGLACCAIEMMSIVGARYDIARFGMEPFRGSPRQADLLIVSGRVSHKMAAPLRQIYDQMLEPKWVIAMGACASSGGMFNNYAVVQSVDKIVPVDMYVPGCPPRPEQLLAALMEMQAKIKRTGTITGKEFLQRTETTGPVPLDLDEVRRVREAAPVEGVEIYGAKGLN